MAIAERVYYAVRLLVISVNCAFKTKMARKKRSKLIPVGQRSITDYFLTRIDSSWCSIFYSNFKTCFSGCNQTYRFCSCNLTCRFTSCFNKNKEIQGKKKKFTRLRIDGWIQIILYACWSKPIQTERRILFPKLCLPNFLSPNFVYQIFWCVYQILGFLQNLVGTVSTKFLILILYPGS